MEQKKVAEIKADNPKPPDLKGKSTKSVSEVRIEKGMTCTLNQFLTFSLDLSESDKRKIVNGQIPNNKKKSFAPWHARATGPIKKSLLSNDRSPVYAKIAALKNHEVDFSKRNEPHDVPNSIEVLNRFLSMRFPEPFNYLSKQKIKLGKKSVTVNGLVIKVTPDFVFKARINGQPVVGAVKLIARISDPLGALQRKIGAYLIHQCLMANKEELDGEILPELCLFVDLYNREFAIAPDHTSAPHVSLKSTCQEFSDLWDHMEELAKEKQVKV